VINVDSFDERDLAKAGYEANPLKTAAVCFQDLRDPDDIADHRGLQADRGQAPRRGAKQELLCPRAPVVALPQADRRHRSWIVRRYGKAPVVAEANTLAFRAGYNSARPRRSSSPHMR